MRCCFLMLPLQVVSPSRSTCIAQWCMWYVCWWSLLMTAPHVFSSTTGHTWNTTARGNAPPHLATVRYNCGCYVYCCFLFLSPQMVSPTLFQSLNFICIVSHTPWLMTAVLFSPQYWEHMNQNSVWVMHPHIRTSCNMVMWLHVVMCCCFLLPPTSASKSRSIPHVPCSDVCIYWFLLMTAICLSSLYW